MKKQRNNWECLPTAMAIATDQSIDYIIKLLGHDGGEIICHDPKIRRGFHIQEIFDVAIAMGYLPVRLEFAPALAYGTYVHHMPVNVERVTDVMSVRNGILETQHHTGVGHAFGVRDGLVYNPTTGTIAENLGQFTLIAFTALYPYSTGFKIKPKNSQNQIKS